MTLASKNFSLSAAIPQLPSGDIEVAREVGRSSSCYIRVENVNGLFDEFKQRKTKFRYELQDMPWQMREMQIDDPYGNAIKFGEPI